MTNVDFHVQGMTCGGCESSVSKAIGQLPGVDTVTATHADETVRVAFSGAPDDAAVQGAVEDAGFDFVGRRS